MRLLNATLAAAALFAAADAAAQTASVNDVKQSGVSLPRYRFTHVPDGVMRLDHQTGQVVFCKSQAAGKWLCNAVPEQGESVVQAQLKQIEVDSAKPAEQLGDLQKQLASSDEERKALKGAIDKAQADSAAAKSELQALRQDMTKLRSTNDALTAELAAIRKDIAAIAAQNGAQRQAETQRAEIARLQNENRELNARIVTLQDETAAMQKRIAELEPPRPPATVPVPKSSELKVPQMPSKEELAQARTAIAEAWKRVVEMLKDLSKDITGKNDDGSMRL